MHVSEAVAARKSVRAFLDRPVPEDLLRELLTKASRAPSGGNLQPWRVFVLNGKSMPKFLQHLAQRTEREQPAYAIYPKELSSPYRDSRFKVGEDMYALLGIGREDKPARFAHLARNFSFSTHRRRSSALSIDRWGHPNGLISVCSCRPSCCWQRRLASPPVPKRHGQTALQLSQILSAPDPS